MWRQCGAKNVVGFPLNFETYSKAFFAALQRSWANSARIIIPRSIDACDMEFSIAPHRILNYGSKVGAKIGAKIGAKFQNTGKVSPRVRSGEKSKSDTVIFVCTLAWFQIYS